MGNHSWVAQMLKNLPTMQEAPVRSLRQEDPLEKGMATHSSILAWRIPRTEEPRGLQSMGSQRVGHNWATNTLVYVGVKGSHFSLTFLFASATAAAKSLQLDMLQSCPTLCDPIDGSRPGSPVPGILQARTLEWVAISFSNACKWKVKGKSLSPVWLLATPWTADSSIHGIYQARVLEWAPIAFSNEW